MSYIFLESKCIQKLKAKINITKTILPQMKNKLPAD